MPAITRPQKITLGDMREAGVRGVLVYCCDYRCSRSIAISADRWPDDVRLSDIEHLVVCGACGPRGADVRPLFDDTERRAGKRSPDGSKHLVPQV